MSVQRVCPQCGKHSLPSERYCSGCGVRLSEGVDPQALEGAWEAARLRKELRTSGGWGILWGVIAVVSGLASMEASTCNAGLLLVGLVLIGTGIAAWRSPSPSTNQLAGGALLLVGGWNIAITVVNITESGDAGQSFWAAMGVLQVIWAIQRFARHGRFVRLQHVADAHIARVQTLVSEVQKAKVPTANDAIEFRARGKRWKGQLTPELVILVAGNAQEVRFVLPHAFSLTAQGEARPGRWSQASIRVREDHWQGSVPYDALQRYQGWRAAQEEAEREARSREQEAALGTPAGGEAAGRGEVAAELAAVEEATAEQESPSSEAAMPAAMAAAMPAVAPLPTATAVKAPPGQPSPLWGAARWPPAVALLNLTGLGLGYLYLKRGWRWLFHAVVTGILIAAVIGAAGSVRWGAWAGALGLWVLWMTFDGWRQARRLVRRMPEAQVARRWGAVAVAVVILALEVGGFVLYWELGSWAFFRAQTAYELGDLELAARYLRQVTSVYGLSGAPYLSEARARREECQALLNADQLRQEGDHERAAAGYQDYLDAYPEGAFAARAVSGLQEAFRGWGEALHAQGKYLEALGKLDEVRQATGQRAAAAALEEAYQEVLRGLSEDTGSDGQSVIQATWEEVCEGHPATSQAVGVLEEPARAWYGGKLIDLPEGVKAVKPGHLGYVVCIYEGFDVVQSCSYSPAGTVARKQVRWTVSLRDVRSGREVVSKTFKGTEPNKCPFMYTFVGNSRTGTIRGDNPSPGPIRLWIQQAMPASPRAPAEAELAAPAAGEQTPSDVRPMATLEPPSQPTRLVVWHTWGDEELEAISELVEAYQDRYPQVMVELVQEYDTDKIAASLAAGEGPDIVLSAGEQIETWAEKGWIVPLNEYVDQASMRAAYLDFAVEAVLYREQVYGLPHAVDVVTLFYNPALIDPEDLPESTDELGERARAWDESEYYFVYDAKNPYFSAAWFYGAGAPYVDDACQSGLDSAEGAAAANVIAAFRAIMPAEIDYGRTVDLFEEGEAAIILNGMWYVRTLENQGIDYGLALLPVVSASGRPASPLLVVRAFVVTASAEKRGAAEAAAHLLQFLTADDAQIQLAEQGWSVPAARGAAEDPRVQASPFASHGLRQAERGILMPSGACVGAMWGPVTEMLTSIWEQGAFPADAAAEAQQAIEREVAAIGAEPTPKPTATPKPSPTPRPTATRRATATPRPTATPIPTATPMPTPTISEADILLADDFAKSYAHPSDQLYRGETETEELYFEEGEYHLVSKQANRLTWGYYDASYLDFAFQVDARLVAGDDAQYGMVFRIKDSGSFYYFVLSSAGQYTLQKSVDGEWTPIKGWTSSPAIRKGKQSNTLKVICRGESITLYVNGQQLATVTDSALGFGKLGMIVGAGKSPPAQVAFDNVLVWVSHGE